MTRARSSRTPETGGRPAGPPVVSRLTHATFGLWFPFFRWLVTAFPPEWVARLAAATAERAMWGRENVREAILGDIDSDIDLLVEFESDANPTLLDMARIEMELSDLLGGRLVDLRTAEDLSRYFRDQVLREAEVQYAAG